MFLSFISHGDKSLTPSAVPIDQPHSRHQRTNRNHLSVLAPKQPETKGSAGNQQLEVLAVGQVRRSEVKQVVISFSQLSEQGQGRGQVKTHQQHSWFLLAKSCLPVKRDGPVGSTATPGTPQGAGFHGAVAGPGGGEGLGRKEVRSEPCLPLFILSTLPGETLSYSVLGPERDRGKDLGFLWESEQAS